MNRTQLTVIAAATTFTLFATVAHAGPIRQRQRHQQARIAQGVRSGALTPAEANALEREQHAIARDRNHALADGHVSPAEARALTREQNRASRDIYRLKHNARGVNP